MHVILGCKSELKAHKSGYLQRDWIWLPGARQAQIPFTAWWLCSHRPPFSKMASLETCFVNVSELQKTKCLKGVLLEDNELQHLWVSWMSKLAVHGLQIFHTHIQRDNYINTFSFYLILHLHIYILVCKKRHSDFHHNLDLRQVEAAIQKNIVKDVIQKAVWHW